MSEPDNVRVGWQDLNNKEAVSLLHVPPFTTPGIAEEGGTLLGNMSVCTMQSIAHEIYLVGPTVVTGGPGDYPTNRDMATLRFLNEAGDKVPITLSGPDSTIFLADNETIDPNDVLVAEFITWAIANAVDANGLTLVSYSDGNRWYFSGG